VIPIRDIARAIDARSLPPPVSTLVLADQKTFDLQIAKQALTAVAAQALAFPVCNALSRRRPSPSPTRLMQEDLMNPRGA
jgi:hypothetical protein